MSGISEVLSDDELSTFGEGADVTGSAPQWQVAKLVTEIRRLRAENKELRASYERVERALNEADPATIWRPMKAKT